MTHWFERSPGQQIAVSTEDPDPRLDDPVLLVGADGPPDWVLIPPGLPESGQRVRVTEHFYNRCPKCQAHRPCLHLVLATVNMNVCECLNGCDFVFYRFNQESPDADSAPREADL